MTEMPEQLSAEIMLSIGQLADRAAADGYYGLQDACLLIAEALGELPEAMALGLSPMLAHLPQWVDDYCNGSGPAVHNIMDILRQPDLSAGLDDNDYALLENQLTEELGDPGSKQDEATADQSSHETIAQLADRAADSGYYGLQDACLLIAEALGELPEALVPELSRALAHLPQWVDDYCNGSGPAVHNIMDILRQPDLSTGLDDNDYALLENQLKEERVGLAVQDGPTTQDIQNINDAIATPPLSKAVLELVELLVMEASLIDQLLAAIAIEQPASVTDGLEQLSDELERYINASQMAGFEGLALICGHVNANIRLFREDISAFNVDRLVLLQAWLKHVRDYLAHFCETDAGLYLLTQLGSEDWPLPVSVDNAATILAHLKATGAVVCDQEQEPRKQLASAEDVALTLPDDVNPELLDILLHELPVQIQQFSAAIQGLHDGGGLADLEIAQRVAHTVKGAANTVGIKGIAELTHYLEDILVACTQDTTLLGNGLAHVLAEAADCLEAMVESVTGSTPPPDDAQAVLQTVLDWANRIEQPEQRQINVIPTRQHDGWAADQAQPAVAPVAPEKNQPVMVRVAAEQMDDLFRLAGENIILNSQANERLRRMKNQFQAMELQFAMLRQLGDELEQLIDLKDLSGRTQSDGLPGLDTLEMDQYNELHTASRRMVEAAFDAREMALDADKDLAAMNQLLEDQQSLITETQESIMKTRLVPVASIAQRLQRSMRQTCRLTCKHCALSISGEHLLIDGDTLNALMDPLMHLLRNAVDHGIETAQERLAAGKPQHGQVTVDFVQIGNHILVRVHDDGRGLDFAAIRAAAERRGAIAPGSEVSEDELKRYILRPNFSTRTQTTQTSGRGVGMDAVHAQVLARGGTLTLQSVQGQGLVVEMHIPLPLSREHALLTTIGPYRLAISSKGIMQILFAGANSGIDITDNGQHLQLGDDSYPATTLGKLLNIREHRKPSQQYRVALLVQNDGQTTAVMLDAVTDSLDIVVKPLGHYIKKIPGILGAAIMGDGSVAPVLDMPELLRATDKDLAGYAADMVDAGDLPTATGLPTVLVVDDSLSQRRALEQLLQDAGFQVTTARDGVEAAEQLAAFRPDIVLTDLEMPRMNGIELTSHIRTRENLNTLPVIIITSRTTQTHRKMAEAAGADFYLVKPVREDDLLTKIQGLIEDAAAGLLP
ncbi:MAG: response regulator [Methylovulum sp.]|nr:response regulator [Methylovulum sp.]